MIAMSLPELAAVVGGRIEGAESAGAELTGAELTRAVVTGPVVTDARLCEPGSLYVARVGEHADGHDFVAQAAEGGAVAALTSRPVPALVCVVVPDVQAAFAALAKAVVARVPGLRVVAVTGSSGKTSTKDLIAQVLAPGGATVAAQESFNGEVGVPLTALRVEAGTRYLVLEMGARAGGHLRYLTGVVAPDIAVVLNVGSAHLGEFGSVEAVAAAKAELVTDLPHAALAVLNADDTRVAAMAALTRARVVMVGRAASADVRADDVRLDAQGRASFTLQSRAGAAQVALALHGEHHVGNALAAAAVGLELGRSVTDVAAALRAARPVNRWRMEVTERPDGVTIVNDAYNANPESVRAALKALASMSVGRRSWAVLGAMLELGPASVAEHDGIGRLVVRLGVSRLVVVGSAAAAMHTAAVMEGSWGEESVLVPDVEAAHDLLAGQLRPGDVVLLKSSRDAGLRVLGDRLAGAGTGEHA